MRTLLLAFITLLAATLAHASDTEFLNIDGGTLDLSDWQGQPVLVVNTASECGFTYQYEGLQKLSDRYAAAGLVVVAVPSDDFNQELGSAEDVKEFCDLNFSLNIPMTDITSVKGPSAHPFYRKLAKQHGFTPKWNFNKVLLGRDGEVVATWRSNTRPMSRKIRREVEALLN